MGVALQPAETDSPLIVDSVSAFAATDQLLPPISRWNPQIFDRLSSIQHRQLSESHLLNIPGEPP